MLGTGAFSNSLVSTSATAADKPTFEFRKTRNAGTTENNAVGRISFYSQSDTSGAVTTESAYIDVTDARIANTSLPRISLVTYNQTVGVNTASLVLGGTQTRLYAQQAIAYESNISHTFTGDVVFNDAVTGTISNATTAATATALSTASGAAPSYSARAWVNFNGTGTIGANQTIRGSGNIASVYKNGTGDYTITFTTAMPDANYAAVVGGCIDNYGSGGYSPRQGPATSNISSSVCRVICGFDNGVYTDWEYVAVTIFR
jgi:hypothetical protein